MRDLSVYFKNKKIDYSKLIKIGFIKRGNHYLYEKEMMNSQFKVIFEISEEKQESKIMDLLSEEEYLLVDVKNSSGDFVGKMKEEYENCINETVKKCSSKESFQGQQTKEVIQYIQRKYQDKLEYLWEKSPDNAVWRNKVNRKWYGVLLVLSERKLKLESDKIVDVLDLRYQKEEIGELIDHETIFEGYHMNKQNWISIRLNGSVESEKIYQLIDNSYELSKRK